MVKRKKRGACSKCNALHNYRFCNVEIPKCINCNMSHQSASPECPIRQQIAKEMKEKRKEHQKLANTKYTPAPVPKINPWNNQTRDSDSSQRDHKEENESEEVKAAKMSIISKFSEILATGKGDPYLYFEVNNKVLEHNRLPTVSLPYQLQEGNMKDRNQDGTTIKQHNQAIASDVDQHALDRQIQRVLYQDNVSDDNCDQHMIRWISTL